MSGEHTTSDHPTKLSARERVRAFLTDLANNGGCDCECWGHEDEERCTGECMVCDSCTASNLLDLWDREENAPNPLPDYEHERAMGRA